MPEPTSDTEPPRSLRQALAQPIERNISDILELESQELERTGGAHRSLEVISRHIARPVYLVFLLIFVVAWITLNIEGKSLVLFRLIRRRSPGSKVF